MRNNVTDLTDRPYSPAQITLNPAWNVRPAAGSKYRLFDALMITELL